VNAHKLRELIKSKVEKYYGHFGVASMLRLNVKYVNDKTKIAIIQVSHGPHRFVTSILPLITTVSADFKLYPKIK
jgi:ribonuclease P/MRP protein subunit POP5